MSRLDEPGLSAADRSRGRGEFRERLAIYLLGVGIGLALLGSIWWQKARMQAAPGPVTGDTPAYAAPASPASPASPPASGPGSGPGASSPR